MSNENLPSYPNTETPSEANAPAPARGNSTLGASSIYRLCEELIALRETNSRQHKLFEQTLSKNRDALQTTFNSFAADTQRAYQQLRQEIHGEKRVSVALLNELMEVGFDLERIVNAKPRAEDAEAVGRWMETIEVECRKVHAGLLRNGLQPYDAVIGSAYNPALHERIGSRRVEGMDPLRVAEQLEHGFASLQPEFVLRRPKVIVTD
jgi:molecular chaperone GrpE (heat shock protein)